MSEAFPTVTRRAALRIGASLAIGPAIAGAAPRQLATKGTTIMPFELPPLPYPFDGLEPHIDARTMELHHDRHHAAYVRGLNDALRGHPQFEGKTVEQILKRIDEVPAAIRTAVRDHGGGHANHQLFWKVLKKNEGAAPDGPLARAIDDAFGSFDRFRAAFQEAGAKLFGSGWVFLVVDPKDGGKLKVHTTPNQDSVLMEGLPALLACDVWEHAYYLTYQNRRADYLASFWDVVDWDYVAKRLGAIRSGDEGQLAGPGK